MSYAFVAPVLNSNRAYSETVVDNDGNSIDLPFTDSVTAVNADGYTVSQQVDVESLTVPAGTFMAIKLESARSWTDAQGTTRTQTVTNWRNMETLASVKQTIDISDSGTLPTTGYPVNRETVLVSTS